MTITLKQDLVSAEQLEISDIESILEISSSFEEISRRPIKKVPTLRGKTIVNLFLEPSTRTRASFEIAGKRLSADVINISGSGSSLVKGESYRDTLATIEAMGIDCLVVRHKSAGAAEYAARFLTCPVINAGDGCHQHPTQALLDLFAVKNRLGRIQGLRMVMVGDVAHSRVARSLLHLWSKLGNVATVIAPPTMVPSGFDGFGAERGEDLDAALPAADVVYVLRVQKERLDRQVYPSDREYAALFGMNARRLDRLSSSAVVMHPGPINRGVEVDPAVAESDRSLITSQVSAGVAVRMAVLYRLLGGGPSE